MAGADEHVDPHDEHDEHVDAEALALGDLGELERAEVTAHLQACRACHQRYEEALAAVGDLLRAVPAVQPPLGFDARVLRRIGIDPAAARGVSRRRWLAGAVAAAAIVVLLAVGAWLVVRSDTPQDQVAELSRTRDGSAVGTVSVSDVAGRAVMVVAIVDAPDDVSYRCVARLRDGRVVESESWPAGAGAWIVPLPDDGVVEHVDVVVSDSGNVWSVATF